MFRSESKPPIACIHCETADLVMFGEMNGAVMIECPHCCSELMTLAEFIAVAERRESGAADQETLQ